MCILATNLVLPIVTFLGSCGCARSPAGRVARTDSLDCNTLYRSIRVITRHDYLVGRSKRGKPVIDDEGLGDKLRCAVHLPPSSPNNGARDGCLPLARIKLCWWRPICRDDGFGSARWPLLVRPAANSQWGCSRGTSTFLDRCLVLLLQEVRTSSGFVSVAHFFLHSFAGCGCVRQPVHLPHFLSSMFPTTTIPKRSPPTFVSPTLLLPNPIPMSCTPPGMKDDTRIADHVSLERTHI